jgi:glycosyltransferase involved in cell wall biosynthesis
VARVLQLITEMVVGGATLTMLDLAEDLASEHELLIAHGKLEEAANPAISRARARFPTYELPRLRRQIAPRSDVGAARDFAALCRRVDPDVIHTHSSKAGFVGRIGAPRGPVLLHTVHGWGHTPLDSPARRRALIGAEGLAALRTGTLIAVSDEVRAEGLALRIGRPSQYAVIGAPVDMRPSDSDHQRARAAARARLQLPPDADVIGWVGRLHPQKDPATLMSVISGLLLERPSLHAVLVGDGPLRPVVQRGLAAEIRSGRALMTGAIDDIRSVYAAFDVLVHTSLWEGHPRVIREALAERVPVVSARVGGTRELAAAGPRLGAVVEPADVDGFKRELTAVLDSDARRAPIDETALASLRASADEPYRLIRELYRRVS